MQPRVPWKADGSVPKMRNSTIIWGNTASGSSRASWSTKSPAPWKWLKMKTARGPSMKSRPSEQLRPHSLSAKDTKRFIPWRRMKSSRWWWSKTGSKFPNVSPAKIPTMCWSGRRESCFPTAPCSKSFTSGISSAEDGLSSLKIERVKKSSKDGYCSKRKKLKRCYIDWELWNRLKYGGKFEKKNRMISVECLKLPIEIKVQLSWAQNWRKTPPLVN